MPKPIAPASVRYIKLGWHGIWEEKCLKTGTIRIGFGTERKTRYQWCQRSEWEKLKVSFIKSRISLREASRFTNEVRHFFEADGSTLWITFHQGLLYWGFLDSTTPKKIPDGAGVVRRVVGGWRSLDINGDPLKQDQLSEELTKLAKYKGSSCKPSCADYVVQRINCGQEATPAAPKANDMSKPPPVCEETINRIIRDTKLAKLVKTLHNYKCQICGHRIKLPDGSPYAEAHHIRPLGNPHKGLDAMDNIVCVCPNHHAELDFGARQLSTKELRLAPGHSVSETYVDYHNNSICKL